MAARPLLLAGAGAAIVLALGVGGLVRAQQEPAAPAAPKPAAALKPAQPAAAPPAAEPEAPSPSPPMEAASNDDEDQGEPASSNPAPSKPVEPLKRPRYAVAVLQALDKVSAETLRFEAPINQPIRYKSLIFIVRACETTAPDETITDAVAHVEIISQPKGPDDQPPPPGKQVFRGWIYANSPGLNLFQHPVYDAWLIACKTAAPST
ncbi:DUF2155 domain-containing protein [Phenylobacterium montanum]|uniref:DUF2155 domain-containing protein n=1 Tax=Phenylobacterium montanum TaxID=2823693 RepID=A0A975FZ65_9CAUL|nr:DUF2155 domain-containing protein [Caulobacter sp. S6]QUD88130.1 DUF2155 domain-containing protein [Caulobacter sp. S6]